jgi:uncharacterized protein (TIGR02246 family)
MSAQESQRPEVRVRAVALGIIAADNVRDLERVLSFYADDAVLLPPGEGPARGKAVIRRRYEAFFRTYAPEIITDLEEVQVAGNWAFVIGVNRGRLVPVGSGVERSLNDVYVMILKQSPEGVWRIARLMWHSATGATGLER